MTVTTEQAPPSSLVGAVDGRGADTLPGIQASATEGTPTNRAATPKRSAITRIHKVWLVLCGETGAVVMSMVALTIATTLTETAAQWLYQGLGAIVAIRFVSSFSRRHTAVLSARVLRTHLGAMLREEAAVTLAFLAACYVLAWPITHAAAAWFVGINLLLQKVLLVVAQLGNVWLADLKKAGNHPEYQRQAILAGTGARALRVADAIRHAPELGAKLIGFLDYHKTGLWRYHDVPLLGHPERLEQIITDGQVDALFIALEPEDIPQSLQLFRVAEKMGIEIYVLPDLYRAEFARTRIVRLNGFAAVAYYTAPKSDLGVWVKSSIDKLGALVALVLVSPVMLASAILIKLDSPGPVFFKQTRSGLHGRQFRLYKFRTMCCDAERKKSELRTLNEMTGPVFKIKNDPRVTRVGRYLRKYSIDELPQLFNVLAGNMSLVGPRPPLPSEVVKFEPWQRRKLSMKPGLTCLWQVNGRNAIDFEDWMHLDLQYIDNWSLALDAKILAKTVPTVLKGSGT